MITCQVIAVAAVGGELGGCTGFHTMPNSAAVQNDRTGVAAARAMYLIKFLLAGKAPPQ